MKWRYNTLHITHTTHFHAQTSLLNLRLMNKSLHRVEEIVVYPDTHYTMNFYAYKKSIR